MYSDPDYDRPEYEATIASLNYEVPNTRGLLDIPAYPAPNVGGSFYKKAGTDELEYEYPNYGRSTYGDLQYEGPSMGYTRYASLDLKKALIRKNSYSSSYITSLLSCKLSLVH